MKAAIKFDAEGRYVSHCTDMEIKELSEIKPDSTGFAFYEITQEIADAIDYAVLAGGKVTIDTQRKQSDEARAVQRGAIFQEIAALKAEIEKAKEDVEQVELFGMERADYEVKKARCAEIVLRLRELEGKKALPLSR